MSRGPVGDDPEGATPITDEDAEGLIPSDIATRHELDGAELENIVEARSWAATRAWTPQQVLDPATLRDLHRRMFNQVWRWAGTWRRRQTNIGVTPGRIATELRQLVDDTLTWIAHGTYGDDEIGVRFHHRLVSIHPFVNGNGRHARLAADLLMRSRSLPDFSWGGGSDLTTGTSIRNTYLRALRVADTDHDYAALLLFARS